MSGTCPGVLAIWNDCAPGAEQEYEHWYRSEHLAERVGIDGFISGWRYRAVDGEPEYFTHYETSSANVLFSEAYRQRVDNPTPLTRRIMSGAFVNCTRTVCQRVHRVGDARGAYAAVVRFAGATDVAALTQRISALGKHEWLLRGELWLAAAGHDDRSSTEQTLRGPDDTVSACMLLETAGETDARAAAGEAVAWLDDVQRSGIYQLMCFLHEGDGR